MDEDQQNIHVQRTMNEPEGREICYIKCVIKSGCLKFEWSIITPSTWDWIGLYENNSKENTDWLTGHWFYIANHSHRETLTDGRYSFTGSYWIGTVSSQNQIRLNTYESHNVYKTYAHMNVLSPDFAHFDKSRVHYVEKGLQHLFSHHKTDWGFDRDDDWNSQNRKKLLETLQAFIDRNANDVNLGTYKNQVYEDILEQIANSEGERDDLVLEYLRIHRNDRNRYSEEVYIKSSEFFGLAESYIPLSFEGRDEITPEDDYELDFEKIREKAGTILGELEKITL
ncbi:uncharacterized protein OCT59_010997 [Rhizophagus irregularis]|uniref:Colicin D C-terminal domain-containing protein n=2 Tax=Rhizophagus irregularis TaxID=588596 RepID=A0A015JSQ0_RHIIW|nr:hypothetical protein GLOIN_2v1808180 [Rhizophagus irregularis DAOM 181602=DAOM 197198]EXX58059.1 hypothetical protein RirG_201420 [Rhizophagus irregularis DAOM 197198w]UZO19724.1 hypothetical protein OCT59_010997 [Rhizophagus irregularis]POG79270.1 hypothetical protein GLOIN_2v1808180 [Rhizophagus irregularis DAOM 181602=DAOM 197198]CAG8458203.1 13071_t:CDS:2 [Rhizophagus irregularis]GBC12760.1 hypothetical protein GLOIN_2v1808180 [Rhizophagus irregularis DAOM 181602=DAOM 197198]|eukprot:XP_025186136.1 hypothetical protein GLOIN_2v1808180 [Rhizophagus irregularis DAOM 181602=DAOM 197198]